MKIKRIYGLAFVIALSYGGTASATNVTIQTNNNPALAWEVTNITPDTTGNMMDGMSVDVTGHNSTVGKFAQKLFWQDNVGVVSSFGWSLKMEDFTWITFDTKWILNFGDNFIESITINGQPANTVFDIIHNTDPNQEGTPGSADGMPFSLYANTTQATGINALYSGEVNIAGSAPVKDLYSMLTLTFIGTPSSGSITFFADTDSVVPEPATMILFGAGLAGLAGFGIKRRK